MRPRHDRLAIVAAAVGAIGFGPAGVWALVAPRSFFDRLAPFEPYNQHFVQDIGAFQIGLGAVLALAALRPALSALAVALLGAGVGAAAHAVSHVIGRDLGGRPATDIPVFAVVAVYLLVTGAVAARRSAGGGRAAS